MSTIFTILAIGVFLLIAIIVVAVFLLKKGASYLFRGGRHRHFSSSGFKFRGNHYGGGHHSYGHRHYRHKHSSHSGFFSS